VSGPRRLSTARHIRDAFTRHPTALLLPLMFDSGRMEAEASRIPEDWWHRHQGPYHNGLWESVSLWAPGGDRACQRSFGAPFAPTEALERCGYLREVMEAIPGEKSRVRLMRLRPGGRIFSHTDPSHHAGHGSVRVHIPIRTHHRVSFLVNERPLPMLPGQAWQVDVRFRHAVWNTGEEDRIHLVVDSLGGEEYRRMAAGGEPAGHGLLLLYYVTHALPPATRRILGLGN
jgi:hypothetical protein